MILAHAAALGAVVVTDGRAFAPAAERIRQIGLNPQFEWENWIDV